MSPILLFMRGSSGPSDLSIGGGITATAMPRAVEERAPAPEAAARRGRESLRARPVAEAAGGSEARPSRAPPAEPRDPRAGQQVPAPSAGAAPPGRERRTP